MDSDIVAHGKGVSNYSGFGSFTETDPQVGATTNNRWCRGNGSAVVCDQNPPSGDNLGSGGTTAGSLYSRNASGYGYLGSSSSNYFRFDDTPNQVYLRLGGNWEYYFNNAAFRPYANASKDLGTSAARWNNGWFAGNIAASSVHTTGGVSTAGNVTINNASPTIYLQDTNHRSGMIHMNSNLMYILTGSANNSTTYATNGSYWPMTINMTNDDVNIGGKLSLLEGSLDMSNEDIENSGRMYFGPWNGSYDVWIQGGPKGTSGSARNLAMLGGQIRRLFEYQPFCRIHRWNTHWWSCVYSEQRTLRR